jgi:chromosome partitioning protein
MAHVITAFLEKGGVGKTTVSVGLGYALASHGRVLLVDGDKQGNLTQHLFDESTFISFDRTILDYFEGKLFLQDAIVPARPATDGFFGIDLLGMRHRDDRFGEYIEGAFRSNPVKIRVLFKQAALMGYDYIIYDLPPSFDFYPKTVIAYCDEVIPVILLEEFAMSGLWKLLDQLKNLQEGYDAKFDVRFAVANMFDKNAAVHRENLEVFKTGPLGVYVLGQSNFIKNAHTFHTTLQEYRPSNALCGVFSDLAQSITKQ